MSQSIFIMRRGERETLTAAIVSLQHIHIIYNMILPFNSLELQIVNAELVPPNGLSAWVHLTSGCS